MIKFDAYWGAAAASWLLAALVIAAELAEPVKAFLKAAFTHHWIGKAVLITAAFIVFGFLLKDRKKLAGISDDRAAWYSMLGCLAVIFAFYLTEFVT